MPLIHRLRYVVAYMVGSPSDGDGVGVVVAVDLVAVAGSSGAGAAMLGGAVALGVAAVVDVTMAMAMVMTMAMVNVVSMTMVMVMMMVRETATATSMAMAQAQVSGGELIVISQGLDAEGVRTDSFIIHVHSFRTRSPSFLIETARSSNLDRFHPSCPCVPFTKIGDQWISFAARNDRPQRKMNSTATMKPRSALNCCSSERLPKV